MNRSGVYIDKQAVPLFLSEDNAMTSPVTRQHLSDRLTEATLRHAQPHDSARILAFQAAALRIHAKHDYNRDLIDRYIAESGTMPRDMLSEGRFFVLEYHGDIIATGGWRWRTNDASPANGLEMNEPGAIGPLEGTYAEIAALYVDPFFARVGLASWLLDTLEADIRRTGLTEVRIAATLTALPLCQKSGYRPFRLILISLTDGSEFQTIALAKSLTRATRTKPMEAQALAI